MREASEDRILTQNSADSCILMCVSKQKFMEMCHLYPLSALSIEMMSHDRNKILLNYRNQNLKNLRAQKEHRAHLMNLFKL